MLERSKMTKWNGRDGSAYGLAIAHAIERDGPIAQFHEVRDLVAPAERGVWETMDQDDRAFGFALR